MQAGSHGQVGRHIPGPAGDHPQAAPGGAVAALTLPLLVQVCVQELDLAVVAVQDASPARPLGPGHCRAEKIEGVLDRPVDDRRVPLGSAEVKIERDRFGHRVPAGLLHPVHHLALELRGHRLASRALARGLDRHVDDQLAALAVMPPQQPELVGYIPSPAESRHDRLSPRPPQPFHYGASRLYSSARLGALETTAKAMAEAATVVASITVIAQMSSAWRCGRRGLARMVVSRRNLAGFRVAGIYSPAVKRALARPLAEFGWDRAPRLWASRHEAEQVAASWRDLPVTVRADDGAGPSSPWSLTRRRWSSPGRGGCTTWRISMLTVPSIPRTSRRQNRRQRASTPTGLRDLW